MRDQEESRKRIEIPTSSKSMSQGVERKGWSILQTPQDGDVHMNYLMSLLRHQRAAKTTTWSYYLHERVRRVRDALWVVSRQERCNFNGSY